MSEINVSEASEKDFTDLTREELIELIVDMYDPEIAQNENTIVLVGGEQEHTEKMFALEIREGNYYVAKFDWTYYNESNQDELNWEQITKEKFRQYIYDESTAQSLNQLRLDYQAARKSRKSIRENNKAKKAIRSATRVIRGLDTELMRRINKKSDIPERFTCIGNTWDKLDATFAEEHHINPNISIWQDELNNLLLTVDREDDSIYIETLAIRRDGGKNYIFKSDESEKGLEAILDKLGATLFSDESESESEPKSE